MGKLDTRTLCACIHTVRSVRCAACQMRCLSGAQLVRCAACQMRRLLDAQLVRCAACQMRCLSDAQLVTCAACQMRSLSDAQLVGCAACRMRSECACAATTVLPVTQHPLLLCVLATLSCSRAYVLSFDSSKSLWLDFQARPVRTTCEREPIRALQAKPQANESM